MAPTGKTSHHGRFEGPKCWLLTALIGLLIGVVLGVVVPARADTGPPPSPAPAATITGAPQDPGAPAARAPRIPLWLCIPFALLLASIALMPFIDSHFWHHHFPDFAFLLGGIVLGYYLRAFSAPGYDHGLSYGQYTMLHAALEYYSFIALVGGLYVASGGILIDVRGRAGPLANTGILALGAVLANLVGTTGASVLLIRPFMRINAGRLRPIHVVMFIFIVSNCGGCLTPIGDPPLYLGYLKGVPFFWTLVHLWPHWLLVVSLLLAIFYVIDRRCGAGVRPLSPPSSPPPDPQAPPALGVSIRGTSGLLALALIVAGVFIDPLLKKHAGLEGLPIGATFQIAVAVLAYWLAPRDIHAANAFSLFPVKEVGLLFIGIFATMAPALGYLAYNGAALGLSTPTAFYFGTGVLSAVLDNAPTYLNFLQVAVGPTGLTPPAVTAFLDDPANARILRAISTGAVFFGAMTYIGNGPNFMVKAIAESALVRMPSFLGFAARALAILLPVLLLDWLVFLVLAP